MANGWEASRRRGTTLAKPRIGEVLLELGVMTQDQLNEALLTQRSAREATGKAPRLGELALKAGWISDTDLARALAKVHTLDFSELSGVSPHRELVRQLPKEFALDHLCVPLASGGSWVRLAVADPTDPAVRDDVRGVLGVPGVVLVVAPEHTVLALIELAWSDDPLTDPSLHTPSIDPFEDAFADEELADITALAPRRKAAVPPQLPASMVLPPPPALASSDSDRAMSLLHELSDQAPEPVDSLAQLHELSEQATEQATAVRKTKEAPALQTMLDAAKRQNHLTVEFSEPLSLADSSPAGASDAIALADERLVALVEQDPNPTSIAPEALTSLFDDDSEHPLVTQTTQTALMVAGQFEYAVLLVEDPDNPTPLAARLTILGRQGWEVVGVVRPRGIESLICRRRTA